MRCPRQIGFVCFLSPFCVKVFTLFEPSYVLWLLSLLGERKFIDNMYPYHFLHCKLAFCCDIVFCIELEGTVLLWSIVQLSGTKLESSSPRQNCYLQFKLWTFFLWFLWILQFVNKQHINTYLLSKRWQSLWNISTALKTIFFPFPQRVWVDCKTYFWVLTRKESLGSMMV